MMPLLNENGAIASDNFWHHCAVAFGAGQSFS
jgi:hypothetical protein